MKIFKVGDKVQILASRRAPWHPDCEMTVTEVIETNNLQESGHNQHLKVDAVAVDSWISGWWFDDTVPDFA